MFSIHVFFSLFLYLEACGFLGMNIAGTVLKSKSKSLPASTLARRDQLPILVASQTQIVSRR
jgi:hypothetical protein